jgi:hypothetical protein
MAKKPNAQSGKTSYYNQNMGKLSGREIAAKKRLDALAAQYVLEGMSEADANERARKEMRDNPRADWRNG